MMNKIVTTILIFSVCGVQAAKSGKLDFLGEPLAGERAFEWSQESGKKVAVQDIGDSITVSIDFIYDQVELKNEREVIRVGATNGESSLLASFYRKGWGDYHSIGRVGYLEGIVFHTDKIGFKNNKASGTSDPLRLTMTLTRQKGDLFDMVVLLENLTSGSRLLKRWEQKGLSFDSGKENFLKGVIQIGDSDKAAGVADRIVTAFKVSDASASPAPPVMYSGVNFKDYILPMEPQGPMVSKGIWGDKNVIPRDIENGVEDSDLSDWCYWDGRIVKDDEGKYHMYASRWTQAANHGPGWKLHSKGIHAVSDDVMGPYIDRGLIWPDWSEGKGSNVVGLRMHDGRYATVTSEITKGEVFVSDTPYGPWEFLGEIKWEANGFSPGLGAYEGGKGNMSNVMIIPRHDGRYMIVPRSTCVMISDNILGPYRIMSDRVYKKYPELPQSRMEDPTAWYSGGMYHMLVNHWPGKTTYHFSSKDGISDWTYRGIAYRKDENIFRYTNGKVEEWKIVQRPTAYTEDGHITHFNFSVLDVTKGADRGNDKHGSKVIVVPFDGKRFDRDMQKLVASQNVVLSGNNVLQYEGK